MRPVQNAGAGGIERYIFYLSKSVADQGHEVTVIDIKSTRREPVGSARVIEIWTPHFQTSSDVLHVIEMVFFTGLAVLQVLRLIRNRHADVIHTHTQFSVFFLVVLRRLLRFNVPIIHTLHNPNIFTAWKRWSISLEVYAIGRVDLLIILSNANKDRFRREFGRIKGRVEVIHTGTDEERIQSITRKNLGPESGPHRTVLCVSRITPRKNQLTILQAVPEIVRAHENVRFVLVGPIDDAKYLETLCSFLRDHGITEFVKITGELDADGLYRAYKEADIFVLPSLWEVQPQALIEAMQIGIPTVASSIAPIKETVTTDDGRESCILFDPTRPEALAQAVIRLLDDQDLGRHLVEEGMKLGIRYNWNSITRSMILQYSSLVPTSKQRADP